MAVGLAGGSGAVRSRPGGCCSHQCRLACCHSCHSCSRRASEWKRNVTSAQTPLPLQQLPTVASAPDFAGLITLRVRARSCSSHCVTVGNRIIWSFSDRVADDVANPEQFLIRSSCSSHIILLDAEAVWRNPELAVRALPQPQAPPSTVIRTLQVYACLRVQHLQCNVNSNPESMQIIFQHHRGQQAACIDINNLT